MLLSVTPLISGNVSLGGVSVIDALPDARSSNEPSPCGLGIRVN